jgi:lipoprotein-releasing system permease protein
MNLEYFIASRVAASGQQSFSRLIIRIAVVAVALSITVMIVAMALIAGFKKEISEKIFGFWGHIHITDTNINRSLLDVYPIKLNQDFYPSLDTIDKINFRETVEIPILGTSYERLRTTNGGIRHIQGVAMNPGIIKAKEEIEGIILKGIGKDFDWEFMQRYLVEGKKITMPDSAASSEILISQQTANRLKVGVGDNFRIHFVENNEQLIRRFEVCGIYKTGLEEYDQKFALVDIRKIQQLLKWSENEVSSFEVFIDDVDDLFPLSEHIYFDHIPNSLYSETIKEKLPEIFEWLELQDINEIVILSLMLIVALINMITALIILILERTNMIGVLKAMGSSNWSIQKIFLYYAAYIIGIGLFWGNLIGIGLCLLQKHFQFIRLSEANYYLSVAPIELNFFSIALLNIGTLAIILLCLILPSYLVTTISPVKAIRFK